MISLLENKLRLFKGILFAILLLLGAGLSAADKCFPEAPRPPRLVNDFANVLDGATEQRLEAKLVQFNDTTSTQITIVTLTDLCGYDASSFAFELGERWGVGNARFDNGIVLLLKPKMASSKGEVFIATGYGLEGVLPDATAKRIVNNEMIPQFKRGDYTAGIEAAVQVIIDITGGEYSAENYNGKKKGKKSTPIGPILFILFIIFFFFVSTINRARRYGQRNNLGLWAALWLMGSANNRHHGKYHDFTSGGGGFGGFGGGGGGFGGFGGGSFGGGGAGGSW